MFLSYFYDPAGTYGWTRTWGSSFSDRGFALGSSNADVYCTGRFEGSVDMAPPANPCNSEPEIHEANGSWDVYLVKYLPDGCWE